MKPMAVIMIGVSIGMMFSGHILHGITLACFGGYVLLEDK